MATLLDQTVLGPQAAQTSTSPLAGILGVNPGETIGSVLGAIGQSLLTSPSKNPLQNLPVALNNANAQRQQQEQQVKQKAALKAAILATGEVNEAMAETMAQSPQAAQIWLEEQRRKQQQANADRDYNLRVRQLDTQQESINRTDTYKDLVNEGLQPGTPQFQEEYKKRINGGAGGKFGLNPVYGTDAQGNTVLMQIGPNGQATQTKLPDGVKVSSGVEKIDLGTQWGLLDKRSGQMVGFQPKDLAGAARETAVGKAQGEAVVDLPKAQGQADRALALIDDIEKDPNLSWGTGKTSWTTAIPGTGMYDFGQKVAQLQGQTFMEAYQSLKGGGQITEVEGQKAEAAIARLNTAQTEAGFRKALADLREVIIAGRARAEARAGKTAGPGALPAAAGAASGGAPAKRLRFNAQTGDFE
ncbi:hypothetical protein [Chelatococcus sp. YT9]|uniref:hypothetical protein n=1 Tax=Chelatococcus sp. YT9 TaxID=2835635 RepID=UPI001BD0524F|nr:hypothetical protein [Chelatococcus sp. YT9]MBS7698602.1 hypothetical protein [Chelatococcus sp. YT9]